MSADYPFPGYHQQQNNLPKAKKLFPSLAAVPSQVLQTNIRRLHDAWDCLQKGGLGFRGSKVRTAEVNTFSSVQNSPNHRMADEPA